MTDNEPLPDDVHMLKCGCWVFTPRADLLRDGERLATTWRHPLCEIHSTSAATAPIYGDGDSE